MGSRGPPGRSTGGPAVGALTTSTVSWAATRGNGTPCLAENEKIIGTPEGFYDKETRFYLPDATAEATIEWLHAVRAQDASKPFSFTTPPDAATPRTTCPPAGPAITREVTKMDSPPR